MAGKSVVYVAPDGETYHFETPNAQNRREAVALFVSACEDAEDDPRRFHILRCEGFAPSKTELEVKAHIDRFGGE